MEHLVGEIDRVAAESSFSGVVRIDRAGQPPISACYGLADRAHDVANTIDTRIGIASGAKGFTALTVVSLIVDGILELTTTARSLLGADLPMIDNGVTIEQLLAHRSGIGDFLDEDAGHAITDYVMTVPVHELASAEGYLRVLDGHPQVFAPGADFKYCNGGFAVLAVLAERAAATPFYDLVAQRVCAPAGLISTAFVRGDELPGDVAVGYLEADGLRSNVLHLPVRGSGDGGISSTAADISRLWTALFAGAIVPLHWVHEMARPRSDVPSERKRYGLGFWLHQTGPAVILEGYDAGASFRSTHDPTRQLTFSVLSNWTDGAWPLVSRLTEMFADA